MMDGVVKEVSRTSRHFENNPTFVTIIVAHWGEGINILLQVFFS
jgi:hypothetical protein